MQHCAMSLLNMNSELVEVYALICIILNFGFGPSAIIEDMKKLILKLMKLILLTSKMEIGIVMKGPRVIVPIDRFSERGYECLRLFINVS